MSEEQRRYYGVLLGIVQSEDRDNLIGMDVNGQKIAMSVEHARLIWDQLGELIDILGGFEEEYCPPSDNKEKLH